MENVKTWKAMVMITILSVGLSTVSSLMVQCTAMRATTIQGAASVEYVNDENTKQDDYTREQDTKNKEYIDVVNSTTNSRLDRVQVDLSRKADKDDFDKVYQKCEENNRLSIEILQLIKEK